MLKTQKPFLVSNSNSEVWLLETQPPSSGAMETDHELDPNILEEIPDTEQEFGPQDERMNLLILC